MFDSNRYIVKGQDSQSHVTGSHHGKTYLHVAVEFRQKQLISYLLFDVRSDPNKLTLDTNLAALHIAVQL